MSATLPSSERSGLARSGLFTFAGASISGLMGLALTVALTRSLGDAGTGLVLQTIGIFTIALSIGRLGMDSSAVWILPRLAATDPSKIGAAVTFQITMSVLGGAAAAAAMVGVAAFMAQFGDSNGRDVAEILSAIAWFVPAAAAMLTSLAVTRGLGRIRSFVIIGNVLLPTLRPIGVILVAAAGGTALAASLAWSIPLIPMLILAVVAAILCVRAAHGETRIQMRIPVKLRRRITGYALPRTLSAVLEQSLIWIDVVIVGAIAGSVASGIYGGASRFIAAGLIVDSALRVVVSPMFSRLIHLNDAQGIRGLYTLSARWLVLLSTPIYLLLGAFAPVVLSWLGPDFTPGARALGILCAGAIVTFLAGNIHSVLLMSGHSGWAAANKAVVIVANVGGNIILIPVLGIEGAAISWAASMVLDAVLAMLEVKYLVGLNPNLFSIATALAIPVVSFGAPTGIALVLWGQSFVALAGAVVVGGAVFICWCGLSRRRLGLDKLTVLSRRSRGPRTGDIAKDEESSSHE